MKIAFNKPTFTGNERRFVEMAMTSDKLSGDGFFSRKCQSWFEEKFNFNKCLLTPSCTQALEMAAILIDVRPGDEIIMPSFTFVSTANAFVLRGAKIVFVDVRPDTMNIDENLIEAAITDRTKAIVSVHYAGVICEMDKINAIANKHGLYVIEDAAQAMMSTYKGKTAGKMSSIATYSFHETKNFTSGGEGGLLIINDKTLIERAEILREKGTNRNQFFRGMIDKYTWMDIGSSFLPSELQAAYLWGQLDQANLILEDRLNTWNYYYNEISNLNKDTFEIMEIPDVCTHNGHILYIKCANLIERSLLLNHMNSKNINAVFHYIPLHSSPAGQKFGIFSGEDRYTTNDSERLIRLPLWYNMKTEHCDQVLNSIRTFYK